MADASRLGDPPITPVCSWCSAEITEGATDCPSCGANLVSDGDQNVPGVTSIDAAALLRSKSPPKPRGRLLSWISGDYATDLPSKSEAGAVAPPDLEVRREILRLELEAEVANLKAEVDAIWAEAAAEGRTIEGLRGPLTAESEAAAEGEEVTDGEMATESGPVEAAQPEDPAAG